MIDRSQKLPVRILHWFNMPQVSVLAARFNGYESGWPMHRRNWRADPC
jgi:hypothetical protein